MQRDRYLQLAVLAGVLALAAGSAKPALAAPLPASTALPAGWSEVNLTTGSGNTSVAGTGPTAVWTVTAIGDDIQGKADRGYFVYTSLPGDGGITARLLTQVRSTPGDWQKNGVMLRGDTTPGSPMITLNQATGQSGAEYLVRTKQDADAGKVQGGPFGRDLSGGPIWFRAQRQGQDYQILLSDDGKRWRLIKDAMLPIDATKPVLAGLDASTAANGKPVAGTATFDNVNVSADVVQPSPEGPTRLQVFPGSGQNLLTWGAVDNAVGYNIYRREAGQPLDQTVLLNTTPTANGWYIDAGPDNKRSLPNGTNYVYTVRAVYKGGAESLDARPVEVQPQLPAAIGDRSYNLYYWGAPPPATLDLTSNVLTIKASGSDIWDVADNGVFLATPIAGDYTITAEVLEKPQAVAPNTSNNVKVGPMIRTGTGPSDPYAFLFATSGRGILWERRADYREGGPGKANNIAEGGDKGKLDDKSVKYPIWLRLTKVGTVITASTSPDGATFTQVGKPTDFGFLPSVSYAGVAMSSGNGGGYGIAKLDASSIKIQ